ncbi:MAG: TonB-dependent receptor [Bacteroidota bacterium]
MKRFLLLFIIFCAFLFQKVSAQERSISGRLTSTDDGSGLPGVNVVLKGTTVGTVSDIEGNYKLSVPAEGGTLVFSFIGLAPQEVEIGSRSVIDIQMQSDVTELSEVVVVGFGSQERKKLTTAVSSIDSKAFENIPVQNFQNALQGRLAGVNVTAANGTLGSPVSIRVRGVSSINASNQPLFVIDGAVLNNDTNPNTGAIGSGLGRADGTNPLININPNDIESIEVLKDAAAAAIYGARGTNGVIIITTKRGKLNQKARVSFNYYTGFSEPTELYDLLDGEQYASIANRAYTEAGRTDLLYTLGSQPNTNWQDLVTQNGIIHEGSIGITGGSQSTSYYIGATHRDEEGFVRSTRLRRTSVRANIDQVVNDKFKVGLSVNPSRSENIRQNETGNVASPITYAALFFPNVNAFDENGNVRGGVVATENGDTQFPGTPLVNLVDQDIVLTTSQVLANGYLQINPTPEITVRTEYGVEFTQAEQLRRTGELTTDGFGSGGTGAAQNNQILNWTWNNTIDYAKDFGQHSINATLGASLQKGEVTTQFVNGNTFADDRLLTLNSAANITAGGGLGTEFSFTGFFLRANYDYKGRYLFSASGRYDGSSRFGSENRYGFFPAVSAGWIISEESFLNTNSTLNFLKLRTSWGQTGNAEINNFASRGLVAFGRDYDGAPGFQVSSLDNPSLQWESASQWDIGLEYAMLNDRIRGSIGYFIKTSQDLLVNRPLSFVSGVLPDASNNFRVDPTITENAGEVRNRGFEFDVSVDIFKGKDFSWTFNFNGATLDNEVTSLSDNNNDGEPDDIVFGGRRLIREGEAIGSFLLVRYAGVDPDNGDALFIGEDGELIANSTPGAAAVVAGNPIPDFQGGFTNTFQWKSFDASIFWQFAIGHQLYRFESTFINSNNLDFNQTTEVLRAWTPENRNTDVPEVRINPASGTFALNGGQNSTRYLEDADYLRLKNLQIGYTLPKSFTKDASIRFYTSIQNLATITDFNGLDPEATGQGVGAATGGDLFFERPQSRTFTFGVNVNF